DLDENRHRGRIVVCTPVDRAVEALAQVIVVCRDDDRAPGERAVARDLGEHVGATARDVLQVSVGPGRRGAGSPKLVADPHPRRRAPRAPRRPARRRPGSGGPGRALRRPRVVSGRGRTPRRFIALSLSACTQATGRTAPAGSSRPGRILSRHQRKMSPPLPEPGTPARYSPRGHSRRPPLLARAWPPGMRIAISL